MDKENTSGNENTTNNKTPTIAIVSIIFAFVFPIVGLVLGIVALNQINKDSNKNGKNLAIAAIILSIIFMIINIFLIIGLIAQFGTMDPTSFIPDRTSFKAPLTNTGNAIINSDGGIEVEFKNNAGNSIKILDSATGDFDCENVQKSTILQDGSTLSSGSEIENGDTFTLFWNCKSGSINDIFKASISFDYETSFGRVMTHSGDIIGHYT